MGFVSSTFNQMFLDDHLPSVSRNAIASDFGETISCLTNETSSVVWSSTRAVLPVPAMHISPLMQLLHRWQHGTRAVPDPLIALCLTESVVMNRTALPWLFRLNFLKIACPFKRRGTWFALLSRSLGPWWDVTIVQQSLWHGGLTTSGCF